MGVWAGMSSIDLGLRSCSLGSQLWDLRIAISVAVDVRIRALGLGFRTGV